MNPNRSTDVSSSQFLYVTRGFIHCSCLPSSDTKTRTQMMSRRPNAEKWTGKQNLIFLVLGTEHSRSNLSKQQQRFEAFCTKSLCYSDKSADSKPPRQSFQRQHKQAESNANKAGSLELQVNRVVVAWCICHGTSCGFRTVILFSVSCCRIYCQWSQRRKRKTKS